MDVMRSALIVRVRAGLARLTARFEIRAIEVDEREFARDEQTGADGQQEPHAQHDVIHHASPPAKADAGRGARVCNWGGHPLCPESTAGERDAARRTGGATCRSTLRALPADRQRLALFVPCRGLQTHAGALVELRKPSMLPHR